MVRNREDKRAQQAGAPTNAKRTQMQGPALKRIIKEGVFSERFPIQTVGPPRAR